MDHAETNTLSAGDDVTDNYETNNDYVFTPYLLNKKIGSGISGQCYSANKKNSKDNFAVKVFDKAINGNKILFNNEICSLEALMGTSGIIKCIESYEDEYNYYVVFELGYSDLFHYVMNNECDEEDVKKIMIKLMQTVKSMHNLNITHRDIKLENIVLVNDRNNDIEPKLIDFGNALYVKDNKRYSGLVGTAYYLSPERLQKSYWGWECKASDVWALGVLCYEALTGKRCFYGSNVEAIVSSITKGEWKWPSNCDVSSEAKDFVEKMINPNAKQRMTIEQAISHPWFDTINVIEFADNNNSDLLSSSPSSPSSSSIISCESNFFSCSNSIK